MGENIMLNRHTIEQTLLKGYLDTLLELCMDARGVPLARVYSRANFDTESRKLALGRIRLLIDRLCGVYPCLAVADEISLGALAYDFAVSSQGSASAFIGRADFYGEDGVRLERIAEMFVPMRVTENDNNTLSIIV